MAAGKSRRDAFSSRAAFSSKAASRGRTRGRHRVRRILLAILVLVVGLPIVECALLRVVDPPFTITMAQRTWDNWRKTGKLELPDHRVVRLEDLPSAVPRAFVSSEDGRFVEHHGFDTKAIREAWEKYQNRKKGDRLAGASTISQQVARNAFLWLERSWLRKGLEAWYTLWLEALVPKERILEVYVNVVETGPMTFGVESAAWRYFGKPASRLTEAEAASIAALLPSPRRWRPDSDVARRRAAWILEHPAPIPGENVRPRRNNLRRSP
jgi:monofunctional glycosyltransferase